MKKFIYILLFTTIIFQGCGNEGETSYSDRLPFIFPDYTDVTVPVNIARNSL
jgi:hypothetical protein